MKHLIIFFLLFLVTGKAISQTQRFEDLNNRLFCNAYTYGKADSTTKKFLQQHFPYLTGPRPKGQISKPPIPGNANYSITSMTFAKHPFFDFTTTQCRLDFETVEIPDYPKFETGAQLSLLFNTRQSADSAFDVLINLYKVVAVQQKITNEKDKRVAYYAGPKSEYYTPKAFLQLSGNGPVTILFKNWWVE